ncbi:MAG: hypothetical protein LC118_05865 [Dehalococcoidia bacterium]|nr:hypothetical protein [Dehalococcoidia bacterium]
MALVDVPGMVWPEAWQASGSFANFRVDAAGEKAAMIIRVTKAGSIRKVHFRLNTVTTPTDTDVRIETVDPATGNPTGTLWAANTNVTVASGSLTGNTCITSGALTADAVVAVYVIAVVIAPSGSPDYNVAGYTMYNTDNVSSYTALYTTSWTKTGGIGPNVGLEYSDGSFGYIPYCAPMQNNSNISLSTSTTPDEVAMKFSVDAPMRIAGAHLFMVVTGDFQLVLYEGTTALATASFDKDLAGNAGSRSAWIMFNAPVELVAGTTYYLAIKPTTTTALTMYYQEVSVVGLWDQMSGGQAVHGAQRVDLGGWTSQTLRRYSIAAIFDQIDDGTGSGSGGGNLHHGLMPPHHHAGRGRR